MSPPQKLLGLLSQFTNYADPDPFAKFYNVVQTLWNSGHKSVKLSVFSFSVAPKETTIWVSPSHVLKEGSPVNLTCSSDGFPAPKILWSRQLNNGELQPLSEDTMLTLVSTKLEDSGIYVCEGINQAGVSKKTVELIIQGE